MLIPCDSRGEFQSHREHPDPSSHLFHPAEEELALGQESFSCSTVCKHIFQISPDFSISKSPPCPNDAQYQTSPTMYFLLLMGETFISLKRNHKCTGRGRERAHCWLINSSTHGSLGGEQLFSMGCYQQEI